jgi:hypothetical protein
MPATRSLLALGGSALVVLALALALNATRSPVDHAESTRAPEMQIHIAGATATQPRSAQPAARSGAPAASSAASTGPATQTPATETPATVTGVSVVSTSTRSWSDASGGTSLQVLLAARNAGGGTVALDPDASTYTVTAAGVTVSTGRFRAALPAVLGPGETGFLVADVSTPLVDAGTKLAASASVAASPAEAGPTTLAVEVADVRFLADGAVVETRLTNQANTAASNVVVGAVMLDRGSRPIAALYGFADVGSLQPGATATSTLRYPAIGRIDRSSVSRVVATAYELGG